MADQTSAADLPYGSVVVDDVVGVAFYAVEEMGISERWHESDTVRGDATVDHAIRRGDAQIVRVGTRAAIAPDARERLARHLYIAGGGSSRNWDRHTEADRIARQYGGKAVSADALAEEHRAWAYARADAVLAVITGKSS